MLPEDALLAEVRAWLSRAAGDLRAADVDRAATPPLAEDSLFHCQQAAEKSLKAFLTLHEQHFRRTHSLEEIGESCVALDPTLLQAIDDVVPLSEYAWAYRYPTPRPLPLPDEVEEAVTVSRRLFAAIVERVPEEARP